MPHFWQIDPTRWINPEHIVYVEDTPASTPPVVRVMMIAGESGMDRQRSAPSTLVLVGEAREEFLAYMARETESPPPPPPA
jgi:hypothetical protein